VGWLEEGGGGIIRMENLASILRQARENKRLTLKDVEAATRIPQSYLLVLEGGAGLMSDHVYLMPFLRTYAKFLGMDTTAVVAQFVNELQQADARPASSSDRRAAAAPSASSRLSFWALPLLLTLAMLLVGSFLWQNGLSGVEALWPTAATQNVPFSEQSTPTPTESSPTVSLATDLPSQPAVPEPTAPIAVAPSSTAPILSPEGTTTTTPPPPAAAVPPQPEPTTPVEVAAQPASIADRTGHRLNIQASSPTWVRIVVDDQPPKEMIIKTGEAREWSAQQGFTLSLGNAGGVTLNLNGQLLPPVGKTGQVVRNIRLPADLSSLPPSTR
jgi:cytoskeleton protein RodZ